jgi:hypothetical protein
VEGATAIGFQSTLERFQVPHEVFGFGAPFAQKPHSPESNNPSTLYLSNVGRGLFYSRESVFLLNRLVCGRTGTEKREGVGTWGRELETLALPEPPGCARS